MQSKQRHDEIVMSPRKAEAEKKSEAREGHMKMADEAMSAHCYIDTTTHQQHARWRTPPRLNRRHNAFRLMPDIAARVDEGLPSLQRWRAHLTPSFRAFCLPPSAATPLLARLVATMVLRKRSASTAAWRCHPRAYAPHGGAYITPRSDFTRCGASMARARVADTFTRGVPCDSDGGVCA